MTERIYTVSGMHCSSCVALVTEDVGEIPGVESVDVELDRGRATVRFDENLVTDQMIVDAVQNAGYEAAPA